MTHTNHPLFLSRETDALKRIDKSEGIGSTVEYQSLAVVFVILYNNILVVKFFIANVSPLLHRAAKTFLSSYNIKR